MADPFRAAIVRTPLQTSNRLELVSARTLSVEAGETVEEAIVVRALTREFLPAHGVVVFFNSNLNATFDPPIVITGADGKASSNVTFGCPGARGVIGAGLQEGFRNSVVTAEVSNGEFLGCGNCRATDSSARPACCCATKRCWSS